MVETYAEDMRHQRYVKKVVLRAIKRGYKPENISISGIQNPDLAAWCKERGVIIDKKQKVDIITPAGADFISPEGIA